MVRGCDLLVPSADTYRQEARITVRQLQRLGVDSVLPIYLALGGRSDGFPGVSVIRRARRGTWSSELREALQRLRRSHVLIWLDDFVPVGIDHSRLALLVEWALEQDVGYLRLNPTPAGDGEVTGPDVRVVPSGSLYRTSTILSIWRRELLLSLLEDSEDAWQFEFLGSIRSDAHTDFYASSRCTVECVNLVIKGRIDPRAEGVLGCHGVTTAVLARPRMSQGEVLALRARELRTRVLAMVPWKYRRRLRLRFGRTPVPARKAGYEPE